MKPVFTRLLSVFLLCTLLAACTGAAPAVPIDTLRTGMLAADPTLPEMLTADSNAPDAATLFAHLSDLDYQKVDAYFLSYSATGLADEVAVIRVKQAADVKAAEQSLRDHVDSRIKLYRNYQPDQLRRVEQAVVFTHGSYAVLLISDQSARIRAAFEQMLAE